MPKPHLYMKQKKILIIWVVTTLFYLSCNHKVSIKNKNVVSDEFIELLNRYQSDSLQKILASNFQLTRTYTNYKNNLNSFLEEYLITSKAYNAKYNVIESISLNEPKSFLVKDESDYLKYLSIESPKWKLTIKRNSEYKIEEVVIDTTSSYKKYKSDLLLKEEYFNQWLKLNHPKENLEELHKNHNLLFERLKSFYNQK